MRIRIVLLFLALTLAAGTTAPLGSVMVPRIVPRKVWADKLAAMAINRATAAKPGAFLFRQR